MQIELGKAYITGLDSLVLIHTVTPVDIHTVYGNHCFIGVMFNPNGTLHSWLESYNKDGYYMTQKSYSDIVREATLNEIDFILTRFLENSSKVLKEAVEQALDSFYSNMRLPDK